MLRRIALVVLCMAALCCVYPKPPVADLPRPHIVLLVHGDVDFTTVQRGTIRRAIAALSQQTAGILDVVVTYDLDFSKDVHPVKGQAWLVSVESENFPNGNFLGATATGAAPATFLAVDLLGDTLDFKHVVMHELLHAIGLHHVAGDGSVMSEAMGPRRIFCFSPSDAAEFCRVARCRSEDLPHCEWPVAVGSPPR